jgi:glutaredoxin
MTNILFNAPVKVYRMSTPEHECPWGLRAINLLSEHSIPFEDILLRSQTEVNAFKAQYGVSTTPQIFVGDQRLGGYSDLTKYFSVQPITPEYSYTPVIALFSTAGLVALSTSLGLTGFMGISLSMLASLKLMDIDSFTTSFKKYDLITQRFQHYGKLYPFAELAIGLGFLSNIAPLFTGVGSLILGMIGAIAPLGIVSFAENGIMTIMGAMLIFSSLSPQSLKSMRSPNPVSPEIDYHPVHKLECPIYSTTSFTGKRSINCIALPAFFRKDSLTKGA